MEKPLAVSVTECQELVNLAEKSSLTLMVGHTFIYTPTVRKIKEIVDSGEIGELMYINCRRLNLGLFQKDINVAWDLAPHDISIVLFIMDIGSNIGELSGQGSLVILALKTSRISAFLSRMGDLQRSSPVGSILEKCVKLLSSGRRR